MRREKRRARRDAHLKPRGGVVGVANVFAVVETQDRGLEDHDGGARRGVRRSGAAGGERGETTERGGSRREGSTVEVGTNAGALRERFKRV